MDNQTSELLEKIRQQFDFGPYPRIPLETTPKDDVNSLFTHSLVTAFYRRDRRVINPEGRLILDAGCGTGYKSLTLALANPGAKVVGVDLSEESVKLARERLKHHGIDNAEFHTMSINDLPQLGMEFDYINCDEVLYLFPSITEGLSALKAVLAPNGIIRSNLHSSIQRAIFFRAQRMFQLMGLMDDNPTEMEMEIVMETMKALKDQVDLKMRGWNPNVADEDRKELILMNYLFQGDKGFTIPELFDAFREADLEFISMVNWRHWEILDLFKDSEDLPVFWAMNLPEASIEQRLHLYELLNPVHRLIDFWCGHASYEQPPSTEIEQWSVSDWEQAQVTLHPQLKTEQCKAEIVECITNHKPLEISKFITLTALAPVFIDQSIAACILKLWEGKQSVMELVDHWLRLNPVNPVTLNPLSKEDAFNEVKQFLDRLEVFLYVLPEVSAQVA